MRATICVLLSHMANPQSFDHGLGNCAASAPLGGVRAWWMKERGDSYIVPAVGGFMRKPRLPPRLAAKAQR